MDQKTLQDFIKRRHPDYARLAAHWNFVESTYDGGREWFTEENIFRYVKEGDDEFKARLMRCYRFNHTREVVDLLDKYLFKVEITRKKDDAPESVKRFWESATLSGLPIKEFVRRISNRTSVHGRVWIVVDNTNSGTVTSVADERKQNVRTYAYIVTPQNAVDMSFDDQGELNWILLREQYRDDKDPFTSSGKVRERYRLWTRDSWALFIPGDRKQVTVEGPFEHGFGMVPVFPADCVLSPDALYHTPGLVDDVAYLDRAVANYLSNLDAIVQDQTFSQLAMPAQGLLPGEEGHDKLVEMGTKRIFTFDGEGGAQPFFLSPDVKQADLIVKVVSKIINEIYHSVGLAGERTKEDNAQGIDNSSGVAKAYDFERVNSLLSSKADALERVENKLVRFVARWHGEEDKVTGDLVHYPDTFDVRGLYDEFEIAARLALVEAPAELRREQMELLIDKLFPMLSNEKREKMIAALKDWPPKPEEMNPATPGSSMEGTAAIKKTGTNTLANQMVKD